MKHINFNNILLTAVLCSLAKIMIFGTNIAESITFLSLIGGLCYYGWLNRHKLVLKDLRVKKLQSIEDELEYLKNQISSLTVHSKIRKMNDTPKEGNKKRYF